MPSSSSTLHALFEHVNRLSPPRRLSPQTDRHLAKYLPSDTPSTPGGGEGLYVARRLLNAAELQAWWKTVHPDGTAPVVDPDSHLSVAYSSTRPDDFTPDSNPVEVPASGIIGFDILGKDRALVLKVRSADLDSRFRALQSAGATSSHPSYTPHVTLCYIPEGAAPLDVPDAYPQLPNFSLKFGPEISGPLHGNVFAKALAGDESLTVYHGSPKKNLSVLHALPPKHQFDNATSRFGVFFTPDIKDASRYAGKNGRVYSTPLPVKHPYEMLWSEFGKYQSPNKGKNGESLPPHKWSKRAEELTHEALARRAELTAAGHDGIIVRTGKGRVSEIASFNDVLVDGVKKPKTTAKKPADVLAKSFDDIIRRLSGACRE